MGKRKYHFIKVDLDLNDCVEMHELLKTPGFGAAYAYIWLQLALNTTNTEGMLYKYDGDVKVPLDIKDIVKIINNQEMTEGYISLALSRLETCKLIYRNSYGIYAITGLYFTGDPLEPVLHVQSTGEELRPVQVGLPVTDTNKRKIAQRTKEKLVSTGIIPLIEEDGISYADLAKEAGVSKAYLSKTITKFELQAQLIRVDKQKYLIPLYLKPVLLAVLKGNQKPKTKDEFLALVNGLVNGVTTLGQNRKQLTVNGVTKYDEMSKKPHNYADSEAVNGVTNPVNGSVNGLVNGVTSLGQKPSTILINKNIRNLDIDDDIIAREETLPTDAELCRLALGSKPPTKSDLSMLRKLKNKCDLPTLVYALKMSCINQAESLAYTKTIIEDWEKNAVPMMDKSLSVGWDGTDLVTFRDGLLISAIVNSINPSGLLPLNNLFSLKEILCAIRQIDMYRETTLSIDSIKDECFESRNMKEAFGYGRSK